MDNWLKNVIQLYPPLWCIPFLLFIIFRNFGEFLLFFKNLPVMALANVKHKKRTSQKFGKRAAKKKNFMQRKSTSTECLSYTEQ